MSAGRMVLRESAREMSDMIRRRERKARDAADRLTHGTEYSMGLLKLAEAHAAAALVYERAMLVCQHPDTCADEHRSESP